jgi:hypothetical protein
MEPLTILIAVAGIVGTGALSKVGENMTDKVVFKSKQLLAAIKEKLPDTANALAKSEDEPLDYSQTYLELNVVAKKDRELSQLFQEMESLVLAHPRLSEWVEKELGEANPQLISTIENWKGINVKGGINTITGNTFQF